jgi:alpha-tubulin suppressor-like RCC1 family protein
VGLTPTGELVTWGDAGVVVDPNALTPGPWSDVVARGNDVCAVRPDGGLVCNAVVRGTMATAQTVGNLGAVSQVVLAGTQAAPTRDFDLACANEGGRVRCWGWLSGNQRALPPRGQFKQLEMGPYASCGLKTDGTLACWGANSTHLLVDALGVSQLPTVPLVSLAVGSTLACALDVSGNLSCWGDGAARLNSLPRRPSWSSLTISGGAVCGVPEDQDAGVQCYGTTVTPPSVPMKQVTIAERTAGTDLYGCGLARADSALLCWGSAPTSDAGIVALPAPRDGGFTQVSCSPSHCCALDGTGSLRCWGLVSAIGTVPVGAGHVSVGLAGSGTQPYPTPRYGAGCALDGAGRPHCFGSYAFSTWSLEDSTAAQAWAVPPGHYTQVAAGFSGVCLLRDDGHPVCFGGNDFGQAPNLSLRAR